MGQHLNFFHPREYVTEGSTWRPPVMTLKDHAGAIISGSNLHTMVLTLYDLPSETIVGTPPVQQIDIKNVVGGRGAITTQGVFTLTLTKEDTLSAAEATRLQVRRALVEYTWPAGGANADAIELTFVIRQVRKRPYVAP